MEQKAGELQGWWSGEEGLPGPSLGRAPCSGQAGAVNESANLEVSLGASREDSLRLGPPTYKTAPAPQRGPRASEIVS